jgi:hypothetical protein
VHPGYVHEWDRRGEHEGWGRGGRVEVRGHR